MIPITRRSLSEVREWVSAVITHFFRILFSRVAIILVAIAVVAACVTPWRVASPRVYPGLDPNLIFVNETGGGTSKGQVKLQGSNAAVITATEGSSPTLHLVDSESTFAARFNVKPFATGEPWENAKVTVKPPPGSHYFSVLVSAVGGTVLFGDIAVSPAASSSAKASRFRFTDSFADPKLSNWTRSPGVDRVPADTSGGHALRITAEGDREVGTYTSVLGPIEQAPEYVVSTRVRSAAGVPHFKIGIAWIDSHKRTIGVLPGWTDWAQFGQPFVPTTVSLWHPRKGNAISLEFGTEQQPTIAVVTRNESGTLNSHPLTAYVAGQSYQVALVWIHAQRATFFITTPSGATLTYSIDRQSGFGLFEDPFVNLSIQASAPHGATSVVQISNVDLFIPARTRYALNVSDGRLTALAIGIVAWLFSYLLVNLYRARRTLLATASRGVKRLLRWRVLLVLGGIASLSFLYFVSALADGHPFDRLSQESAAYVINQYGVDALYGRTSAIPDAIIRGGSFPWNPAEFVYPPGLGDFFIVVGKAWQFVNGHISPMNDRHYYVFWKLALTAFVFVAAGLIFAVSKRTPGGSTGWGWLLAALFAISPAVIFDAPIWGQTNALLSAALLLSLLALVIRKTRLLWASMIVALLLKQTALFVVPLIAVFALRRFGLRRTAVDAAFGLAVGFAFMTPFVLAGYHPATAYLTTVEKLIDFGTPLTQYDTQVSADTFPVWVLFSGFSGLHGHDRLWASDHTTIGSLNITYANAGLVLFLIVSCIAAWTAWLAARGETPSYRRLFLSIALVIVAYVTLNTRTSGHYLTLALPYLLLGLRPGASPAQLWKFLAVTATAVVSIYGLFMFIAARGEWPNFAGFGSPTTNTISSIVYNVYTSDVFITLFAALLLYVTVHLLIEVLQRPEAPAQARPSATREPQPALALVR